MKDYILYILCFLIGYIIYLLTIKRDTFSIGAQWDLTLIKNYLLEVPRVGVNNIPDTAIRAIIDVSTKFSHGIITNEIIRASRFEFAKIISSSRIGTLAGIPGQALGNLVPELSNMMCGTIVSMAEAGNMYFNLDTYSIFLTMLDMGQRVGPGLINNYHNYLDNYNLVYFSCIYTFIFDYVFNLYRGDEALHNLGLYENVGGSILRTLSPGMTDNYDSLLFSLPGNYARRMDPSFRRDVNKFGWQDFHGSVRSMYFKTIFEFVFQAMDSSIQIFMQNPDAVWTAAYTNLIVNQLIPIITSYFTDTPIDGFFRYSPTYHPLMGLTNNNIYPQLATLLDLGVEGIAAGIPFAAYELINMHDLQSKLMIHFDSRDMWSGAKKFIDELSQTITYSHYDDVGIGSISNYLYAWGIESICADHHFPVNQPNTPIGKIAVKHIHKIMLDAIMKTIIESMMSYTERGMLYFDSRLGFPVPWQPSGKLTPPELLGDI